MASTRRAAAITTRPQQPTDSPAASLPNETLAHIFDLSLERMKPWDKQLGRINFGKVCYTWYGVALPLRDCVVPDSKHAQDLATVLKAGRMGERAVRSLELEVEPSGAGRGNKIAKLLRLCRGLERLRLTFLDGAFLSSAGSLRKEGPLGKPLTDALKTLKHLNHVELDGMGPVQWSLMDSFFESWPKLHTFIVPDITVRPTEPSRPFSSVPSLRRLAVSPGFGPLDFEQALVRRSTATLKVVELGAAFAAQLEATLDMLGPVLPQLTTFSMIDGLGSNDSRSNVTVIDTSSYIEMAMQQFKAIRCLTLGIHALPFEKLFSLLPDLEELCHFTLDLDVYSKKDHLKLLQAPTVINYLDSAPSALRTLSLPNEIIENKQWPRWKEDSVFFAAWNAGVKIWWINKVPRGQADP